MPRGKRVTYNEDTGITYIGDNHRYHKRLFRQFREEFPNLWEYGTNWEPHGYREIRIFIPSKGILIYNEVGTSNGKITWEVRREDPRLIKQRERELRPEMYQNFLRELDSYQKRSGFSQRNIAMMTGVSRQKINAYINGKSIPKVSTMRKIADTLGLDI